MNRLPLLALVALACMLTALILLEVAGGDQPAPLAIASARPRVPHPPAAVGVPATALQDWTSTILARPLFSPSRRPSHAAVASTALPRLAGIIIGPQGARAIFASAGDARAIIAGPGSHAGPYLVRAVAPTGVAVTGPNGLEMLHPAYDHDAASGGGAAPVPPAGGTPSILDLLRARMRNGGAALGLPQGGPAPVFPQSRR